MINSGRVSGTIELLQLEGATRHVEQPQTMHQVAAKGREEEARSMDGAWLRSQRLPHRKPPNSKSKAESKVPARCTLSTVS